MKIMAIVTACFLWLFILSFITINLRVDLRIKDLNSILKFDTRILFWWLKVEVKIPRKMYAEGLINIVSNIIEDTTEGKVRTKHRGNKSEKKKKRRYWILKNSIREFFRHYAFSWPKFIWLMNQFSRLNKAFFRKVKIHSIQTEIEIGGRDAAETGLLAGAFWAINGLVTARLYNHFTVRKENIKYNVIPHFDKEILLCKLICILSFKTSHIIFTGYKYLFLILKNRRPRKYGGTSN